MKSSQKDQKQDTINKLVQIIKSFVEKKEIPNDYHLSQVIGSIFNLPKMDTSTPNHSPTITIPETQMTPKGSE